MARFFITRIVIALLVAATVSVVGFSLLRLSGNLAAEIAGEYASPEEVRRTAAAYGLDKPLLVQYLDWVHGALKGRLGASLFTKEPVTSMITSRLAVTVKLALFSLLLALFVSLPLGTLAATQPGSWLDRGVLVFAGMGQAMPNFFLGLVLMIFFAVKLRWTPISGSESLSHFILPTVTLGFSILPSFTRLTRSGMIEVLESDFIRTARAKGLSDASVLFKHGLRNAVLPVVSLSAVSLGGLMGGSVIIETVFALNGIGFLAYQSIQRADFPVVQSIVVFISFVYILLTLMSDLVNARLDPRIRLR